MNRKLINTLLFATGAAVGSLVTWKIVKTRYDQILQEEIDSFKEIYTQCMRESSIGGSWHCDNSDMEDEEVFDDVDMTGYHTLANRYKNSGEKAETDRKEEGDDEVPYINGPYVIEPEDFADGKYDHDCYCINYYSDGVLADDWGVELDIEETIGLDALEHFGDHEEDVVHVRNERLRADYEVTKDPRKYTDVVADDPQMHMYAN